jgi:hypothetical protein
MGPTVWELEGPMPILKSSKRLVFTDDFHGSFPWMGTASAIVPGTSRDRFSLGSTFTGTFAGYGASLMEYSWIIETMMQNAGVMCVGRPDSLAATGKQTRLRGDCYHGG